MYLERDRCGERGAVPAAYFVPATTPSHRMPFGVVEMGLRLIILAHIGYRDGNGSGLVRVE